MPYLPPFIAPTRYRDAAAALAQVRAIYAQQIGHLREAMQRFVAGDTLPGHVRACYPFVRIHTDTVARLSPQEAAQLSYGFVAGPGRYETTLTRPDLYGDYYLEQFACCCRTTAVELEVGTSTHPIPVHFSFAEHDHIEGTLDAQRRLLMRDVFDLPDLAAMDDGIANGTWEPRPGEAQPLSLFTAARVDYSLHRLRHYTGTAPEGSRTSCCSPTTSSTSTSSCGWATRRCANPTANTSPSSSLATWSLAAPVCLRNRPTRAARRRRACRKCRPTT
jgi:AMP nucleosidase